MSNAWPTVSLGELLRLERRPVKVDPSKLYQEIGIYCFGRGIFHKAPRTGIEVGDKDLFSMKEADFILQVTFAWEGAIAIVSAAEDGMYGSTRYPTFRVDESRCVPHFLLNYFKTPEGLQQLIKICPGSAGRNRVLSIKRISEVLVPLPPLVEQRRVVARIEDLASRIQDARSLRDQAAEEAEAFMTASISAHFEKLGKRLPLGETGACRIICGQHLNPEDQAESGTPYMTGPADFGERIAKPSRFARIVRATAEPGDVLLTVKGAGVGKVNLAAPKTCAIGRQLYALRPDRELMDQTFLYYTLQNGLLHFRDAMTATTVPGIGRKEVEALQISLPPLPEQCRIVSELDALQGEVGALKRLQAETAAELDALLPAVLSKAFAGQLIET
jgi:type I restriction enzyme S subunit